MMGCEWYASCFPALPMTNTKSCRRLWLLGGLGVLAGCASAPAPRPGAREPRVVIRLAGNTEAEARTRAQLLRLLGAHDLSAWSFTRSIRVDQDAVPHSHPVLTLHTRHLAQDDLLLATYIHEQCHWHLERRAFAVDAAVAELRRRYPRVPVGGRDGARSERSSYEHLIIGWLELDGVRQLLGPERARRVLEHWTHDHYRWIYRTVLADAAELGRVVRRHGLVIASRRAPPGPQVSSRQPK